MSDTARITASYGRHYTVRTESGQTYTATARGKRVDFACGDRVHIEVQNGEQAVIRDFLPRRSLLYRQDAWRTKLIAANVDRLFIVTAAVPSPSEMLLQRALLAAEAGGIEAFIVLNKTDLPESAAWREKLAFYEDLGYPLATVSALENAETLRPLLQGCTSIFLGQSGMGKSTLVSLILRLYDPSQGRVLIDGMDIRGFRLKSLREQISIVLPNSLLFAASIRDNIGYGAASASFAEIEQAARLANAHDFIMAMPNGYDTELGERGVTLSSGQQQRIAIARAALRQSPILILDEPTTGLDRSNEQAVIEALGKLARGRTVIMITHDLDLAARADQIVFLENGSIIEQGSHAELLGRGGPYAALFRARNPSASQGRETAGE